MSPSSTARGVSSRIQFNKLCIRAGRNPCGRLIPTSDRSNFEVQRDVMPHALREFGVKRAE